MKSESGRYGRVESQAHRSMKAIVKSELEHERYAVVEEPLYPPGGKVFWYKVSVLKQVCSSIP